MMLGIFKDLLTHTYSSGVSRYLPGRRGVIIDRIPEWAPQDWTTGPKQEPGKFGLYLLNDSAWEGWNYHGRYAIVVEATEDGAAAQADGFFRQRVRPWRQCNTIAAIRAAVRSEGLR